MAWLTGWNRRKSKIVNGSSTSQVNYQMQLTVHKGTGTDTATDIYLGTNVRDDFGDVRFTISNGSTPLNYWIESYTSGSVATVWVQIGSIPTTGTTIYIYYDYPSQTTTSNGSSTFDFFDNFESYSIGNLNGQGGWTGYTYYQVSSSNPHSGSKSAYATNNDGINPGPDIYTGITASKNFTVTWYVYYSGGISLGIGALYPSEGTTQIARAINDAGGQLYDSVGALGYTMSTGKWYKFQLTIHDDNKHDIKVFDGTTQVVNLSGRANTANMTTGVDRLYLYHDFRFNTGYMDDISIRKYASPEPTFGASGTEENSITATYMTVTTNQTPCLHGACTVTATVTWTNQGTSTGSFVPSLNIDGTPITSPYPSENLNAGTSVDHAFDITNLATGTRTICPNPN